MIIIAREGFHWYADSMDSILWPDSYGGLLTRPNYWTLDMNQDSSLNSLKRFN